MKAKYYIVILSVLLFTGSTVKAQIADMQGNRNNNSGNNEALFNTGIVFETTSGAERGYNIPAIDVMPNGDLLCVAYTTMTDIPYAERKYWITGKISKDGGKTWGSEFPIMEDNTRKIAFGDPSIVMAKGKVTVISTGTSDQVDKWRRTIWKARTSTDNGRTWGEMREISLPHNWNCGNLSHAVNLRNGTVLRPYAFDIIVERYQETALEGEMVCRSSVLASKDGGMTWEPCGELFLGDDNVRPATIQTLDEPAVVELTDRSVWMLMRAAGGRLLASTSTDDGKTWSLPGATPFRSCPAPAALHRVSWKPNLVVAMWNNSPDHRWPLDIAASYDDCKTWPHHRTVAEHDELEQYQVSYPSITSLQDGTIIAVWQDDSQAPSRRAVVRYARFNEVWVREGKPLPLSND